MKKFFTAGYKMHAIDTETLKLTQAVESTSTMIDYAYIIKEDGVISDKDGNDTEVKAGDLVLQMYGIYDPKKGEHEEKAIIILEKDTALAKYIFEAKRVEEERESLRCADTAEYCPKSMN